MNNLQRITEVKTQDDFIDFFKNMQDDESVDVGFDMTNTEAQLSNTEHTCGSACCIGGWARMSLPYKEAQSMSMVTALLRFFPHVPKQELSRLCFPIDAPEANIATPKQAARALEILRDTKLCDWALAIEETQ